LVFRNTLGAYKVNKILFLKFLLDVNLRCLKCILVLKVCANMVVKPIQHQFAMHGPK